VQPFLAEIATNVIAKHKDAMHEIAIVIPSKRAALFLKNEFKKQLSSSFFMPDIITINDFISEHNTKTIIDSSSLLFEFYNVYTSIKKDNAESFDSFVKWAPGLLSDFSEVDRYLIDPSAIFSDLRNVKEIENWSFNSTELSDAQINYLDFWNSINQLYTELHLHLEKKDLITSGGAYRNVANSIDQLSDEIQYSKLYFVGFNALSNSEKQIIKSLQRKSKAELIFDIDKYYLDIEGHEAAYFYNKISKELNVDKEWIKENTEASKNKIRIIAAPNDLAQAQVVSEIVNQNRQILDNDSAIVLSDQSLLLPILDELPDLADSANITMGYPPKLTLTINAFNLVLKMHDNSERYSSKDVQRFHFTDVFHFLEHPIISKSVGDVSYFKDYCIRRNISFINFDEVFSDLSFKNDRINDIFLEKATNQLKKITELMPFVFARLENGSTHPQQALFKLAELLRESKHITPLEKEALFIVWSSLNKIERIYSDFPFLLEANYFKKIFKSIVGSEQIDLVGEPLKGIQIIGMLETRLIDYKNLVITSVNEGILPKSKIDSSIIPYDLKRFYGLPTYKEQDAIYAYYFYRLLHRSENVWIVYNSDNEGFSSGEQSRYLLQLKHEFLDKSKIEFLSIEQSSTTISKNDVVYHKDEFYYSRLNQLISEKGLSPSAINTWITCPRNFYVKYILGLREQDEIEEEIGDNVLGTVIHNVLEELYKPTLNQQLTEKHILSFKQNFLPILETSFIKEYSRFYKTGKNYISFNIAQKLIDNFLSNELELIKQNNGVIIVSQLEKELSATINITIDGEQKSVLIRGFADRIDSIGGNYRVLDYKTGRVENKDIKFNGLNDLLDDKKDKARQLFLYGYMFLQQNPNQEKVSPQIIKISSVKDTNYPLVYNDNLFIKREDMPVLEDFLSVIISQMFDKSLPLGHNSKSNYCIMCD
jgi:ATP-dependent helicase/nuclease subunit B